MTTKSKHKPVTLAKSVADYDKDIGNAVLDQPVETVSVVEVAETVDVKPEKSASKPAKASKAKVIDAKAHDAADVTALYRTIAERTLDQARQAYTKAREEALTFTDKLEESSTALTSGTSAVQTYVVHAMQSQADEMFGYFRALADVKTMSDAIELQSAQSRKALDQSLRQFKDLSALINEMAVKASTPIRSALPIAKS